MQNQRAELQAIGRLTEVADRYDALFCDVWGVVHDGVRKSPAAEAALVEARRNGLKVVLITNSPRLSPAVQAQLDALHVSRDAYDALVTSGDVTRALIAQGPSSVFHIGPPRDLDILKGLDIALVGKDEAESVVATGLFDDEAETPEDYCDLLAELHARGLTMVCANPDIIVHRGTRLIYCAGVLAEAYARLGGAVRLAGKPHAPIYEVARQVLDMPEAKILCIGDGLLTDIEGAQRFGLDALFVVEGIHGEEFAGFWKDADRLSEALSRRGLRARYAIPSLT